MRCDMVGGKEMLVAVFGYTAWVQVQPKARVKTMKLFLKKEPAKQSEVLAIHGQMLLKFHLVC